MQSFVAFKTIILCEMNRSKVIHEKKLELRRSLQKVSTFLSLHFNNE